MQLIIRYLLALFAGWVASDIYNEYQNSKNAIVAAQEAAKKNLLKWIFNLLISGVLIYLILLLLKKLKIIKE